MTILSNLDPQFDWRGDYEHGRVGKRMMAVSLTTNFSKTVGNFGLIDVTAPIPTPLSIFTLHIFFVCTLSEHVTHDISIFSTIYPLRNLFLPLKYEYHMFYPLERAPSQSENGANCQVSPYLSCLISDLSSTLCFPVLQLGIHSNLFIEIRTRPIAQKRSIAIGTCSP